MKDLRPTRSHRRLLELIGQGEHEQQDFKYVISDARKIARSVSAFSNNAGGRLLIGVKDNGTIAGVRSEEDIYMIEQAAGMYCHPPVTVDFEAVRTGGQAVVFIAGIPRVCERPVMVKEADGRLVAYYRVNDENLVAPDLMVEAWRRRLDDTGMVLSLSDIESDILKAVDAAPGLTPEQIAAAVHASTLSTRSALTRLLALGMLEYRHAHGGFLIFTAEM